MGTLKIMLMFCFLFLNLMTACFAETKNIEIPAGRTIDVKLKTEINAERNQKGDVILAILDKPFYDNDMYLLPAGSSLHGYIAYLKKPEDNDINAEVKVVFDKILLPKGQIIPVIAEIETEDSSGVLVGHPRSIFSKVKSGFESAGKKTAITAAKTTAIRTVTPKSILTAVGIGKTAQKSVTIAKNVKEGNEKKAAIETGKEVVKYTPYGTAYKLSNAAVKGVKSSKQMDAPPGMGYNLFVKKGTKFDIILKKPVYIPENWVSSKLER